MNTIKVKVLKFSPNIDNKPYFKTYSVPWKEMLSVLEVCRYIHDELEPLAFDYSCHQGGCGLCGMKINGTAALACESVVHPSKELILEPLDGFRVIRDLIIDRDELRHKLIGTMPWFSRLRPMTEPMAMKPEDYIRTGVLQMCCECMLCHSECPAVKKFGLTNYAGPMVLTKIAARYVDTREDNSDERLRIAVREGLFNCLQCGKCTEVCPKGGRIRLPGYPEAFIDHVKIFREMMKAAEAKGYKP